MGSRDRVRSSTMLNGFSLSVKYGVHNSNIVNLERAVKERVFYVARDGNFVEPPRPVANDHFDKTMCMFEKLLGRHLPSTAPIARSLYPELYVGRKKVIYQEAADSLLTHSVEARDALVRCFVKAEKINLTKKGDPAPRVISPRSPRYNVEVGRYLKPIEERVYKAIGKVFGMKTVFKGLNARQSGQLMADKWGRFKRPVAVGLDASRFDQHVSKQALSWEHKQYIKCFPRGKRQLGRLLSWQLANKCVGFCSDGKLKYVTDGGRMSGDVNTALGNCLLMCAMVWSYCKSVGLNSFELANNGDDCVVVMECGDLSKFMSGVDGFFLKLGFTMVVEEPVYELEQIDFCQTRPVWTDAGYIMVRDPRCAISKDSISVIPRNSVSELRAWMSAVGEGGISLTGGIPIWQEYYSRIGKASVGKRTKIQDGLGEGFKMLAKGMDRKFSPVHPRTRYSFWLAFGLQPSQQLAAEEYFRDLEFSVLTKQTLALHNCQVF